MQINKKQILSEHMEQALYVQWCRRAGYPVFAIPNGGARHVAVAAKLKLEGVSAGVPDLFVPVPIGQCHGLFVEMKRRKGSSTSSEQKKWHAILRKQGYKVAIAKGKDEAIAKTLKYIREEN